MGEVAGAVTVLLRAWRAGDHEAFDKLVPLLYAELRAIARRHIERERPGHTLRPTDLVSEAYLRLSQGSPELVDRVHFLAVAARTMRQILVDHARKKRSAKRGKGERPVPLEGAAIAAEGRSLDIVALDAAIEALARLDERKARVVELHYFGGLTQPEIASVLDIHVNTVTRDLKFAVVWLRDHLSEDDPVGGSGSGSRI